MTKLDKTLDEDFQEEYEDDSSEFYDYVNVAFVTKAFLDTIIPSHKRNILFDYDRKNQLNSVVLLQGFNDVSVAFTHLLLDSLESSEHWANVATALQNTAEALFIDESLLELQQNLIYSPQEQMTFSGKIGTIVSATLERNPTFSILDSNTASRGVMTIEILIDSLSKLVIHSPFIGKYWQDAISAIEEFMEFLHDARYETTLRGDPERATTLQ
jgi:hypothetical protein